MMFTPAKPASGRGDANRIHLYSPQTGHSPKYVAKTFDGIRYVG
jgi:hypothetical protein